MEESVELDDLHNPNNNVEGLEIDDFQKLNNDVEGLEKDDFEVDDLQNSNNDVEGLEAPSSGMSFGTIEEARKYYEDYGRENGFWIRTRTSSKGKNRSNDVTSMLFVCAKEGKYVAKIEKDGVEGNDEREEDDNVISKKRKRSCSTVRSCSEPSQIFLSDPNISQTKGRKKDVTGKGASIQSGRLKSGIEMALNKRKRKCNLCKKLGHDKRTCPENPMSKTYKALEAEAENSGSEQEVT